MDLLKKCRKKIIKKRGVLNPFFVTLRVCVIFLTNKNILGMTNIGKNRYLDCVFGSFFYVDSSKFLIDISAFKNVNIPEDFTLFAGDELISEFKRKSFPIEIDGQTVYLGKRVKKLRGNTYNDVVLLFSAKLNPVNYFYGIDKTTVKHVLNFVKQRGFIDYDNVDDVIQQIRIVDVDITINQCSKLSYEQYLDTFKRIRDKYVLPQKKSIVENYRGKENRKNAGLEFNKRHKAYYFKIYLKSVEIRPYLYSLNMTDEQRYYLESGKSLLRYEFTIRNKREFENFLGITNKLVDLWDIIEDKEKIIKLLRKYFDHYVNMKKMNKDLKKDVLSSLNVNDELLVTAIEMLKAAGYTDGEIYHNLVNDTVLERNKGVDISTAAERKRKERRRKKIEKYLEIVYLDEEGLKDLTKEFKEIREAFSLLFEK